MRISGEQTRVLGLISRLANAEPDTLIQPLPQHEWFLAFHVY